MSDRKHTRIIKRTIVAAPKESASFSPSALGATLNECLFDPKLALAKLIRIARTCERLASVLVAVRAEQLFPQIAPATSAFARATEEISAFARECDAAASAFAIDARAPTAALNIKPERADEFPAAYEKLRESATVRLVIQVCDRLAPYKAHIADQDALTGHFLETMPGVSFEPFAAFDVKDAYIQEKNPRAREFLLLYLHKLYDCGFALYQEYVTPDMNVDSMTSIVRDAIARLRHEPALSRCADAFSLIERSLSLMRENFGKYYTDFLQSRSTTTIFEHFILDVAHTSKSGGSGGSGRKSAVLAQQFQRIVEYYRSSAQKSGMSKQAEALFTQFSAVNSRLGVHNLGRGTPARERGRSSSPPAQAAPRGDAATTPIASAESRAPASDIIAECGDGGEQSARDDEREPPQSDASASVSDDAPTCAPDASSASTAAALDAIMDAISRATEETKAEMDETTSPAQPESDASLKSALCEPEETRDEPVSTAPHPPETAKEINPRRHRGARSKKPARR